MRNQFSARWTGLVEATATGNFQLPDALQRRRAPVDQRRARDRQLDQSHGTTDERDAPRSRSRRTSVTPITMEFYDNAGTAVAKLYWKTPGQTDIRAVCQSGPAVCELGAARRSRSLPRPAATRAGGRTGRAAGAPGRLRECGARPARRLHADRPAGQSRNFSSLRGSPALVFFGFAHCPNVCPTTLGRLKLLHEAEGGALKSARVVLVSVDGERDTPAR